MITPFKIEFELEAFEKADAAPGRERRIGGFVSTDHMDKQQEKLIQEGLDFRPFLKGGFFNDNHLKDTGKAVGYPELCELRPHPDTGKKGWYVEGYLLKGHPPADDIWSFASALKRSGAPRKLGYSVEGGIIERDPDDFSTIRKAVVREVAITRCPVNDHTGLTLLAKSLSVSGTSTMGGEPGDGGPLRVQALEGVDPSRPSPKKKKKLLTKSEAVLFLMARNPALTKAHAIQLIEYAAKHHPAESAA